MVNDYGGSITNTSSSAACLVRKGLLGSGNPTPPPKRPIREPVRKKRGGFLKSGCLFWKNNQRRRDDNKNKICGFDRGELGAERKIVQDAVFRGKRHDNIILKVQILLSRHFVVIAQAPEQGQFRKILAPIKIKSALPPPPKAQIPPPPKTRNFMDMVFLQKERIFARRP